jgi:hypothetical protein
MLVTILIAFLIFLLIWWLISIVPLPSPIAQFRWIAYAVLVIAAIIFLLNLGGIHLP